MRRYTDLQGASALFVVPIAAVVEVGNHIAQLAGSERRKPAQALVSLLRLSLQGEAPWAVSGTTWDELFLRELVDGHPVRPGLVDLCQTGVGTGDGSILLELQRYRQRTDIPSGLPIELWTLDQGLQAYA